ncbi:MAG: hypothetical protein MI749_02925 [Desulfovibrionales bacterium]|nr:hypothetical protein [Desulfovibrionales bacterium]
MGFKKTKSTRNCAEGTEGFFNTLLAELPPLVPRKDISKYVGSLFSAGYLANLDSAGKGPVYKRIGGIIVYKCEDFVHWLESRTGDS